MEALDREITRALAEEGPDTPKGPARILLVGIDERGQTCLVPALKNRRHRCTTVLRLGEARASVSRHRYDVILLNTLLPDGRGLELMGMVHKTSPATKVIVLAGEKCLRTAVSAMRAGAVDFLDTSTCDVGYFLDAVEAAVIKSRVDQQRELRIVRLKRICRELNTARRDVTEQVDGLCHDLASAYKDLAAQMNDVALATEFRTLIRQELDVEDLLRTKLEYLLTKTGATNAAVFLPDHDQNFGLGAYVNYDCPRESIAILLDHLCQAICPQMAEEHDLVLFDDAEEFARWIGMDSGMLGESQVIAFSCRHDGQCLAVVVLFRDRTQPFDSQLGTTIDVLRPIFAKQLANIIGIHHRAAPDWPDDACDETDYNDDYGFGYGDPAAA